LKKKNGSFTISLDFELYWGMRDVVALEAYRKHLLGVWKAVPAMLALFEKYDIHATWATVGFLWHEDVASLKAAYPDRLPEYEDRYLSPYVYLENVDKTEVAPDDWKRMHFAKTLIKKIKTTPHQEIATHTYSHYYTREPRIVSEAFDDDLKQAVKIASEDGIEIASLVFPRNQIDPESLEVLKKNGIGIYRGNPDHWAYREGETGKTFLQRLYRFADIYMNLSGYHTTLPKKESRGVCEVKSSMFLRPYSPELSFLESRKRKRIKDAMRYAAQQGENFHLWWHPHNFGVNMEKNLENLEIILQHYQTLNKEYGMLSLTMRELGESNV